MRLDEGLSAGPPGECSSAKGQPSVTLLKLPARHQGKNTKQKPTHAHDSGDVTVLHVSLFHEIVNEFLARWSEHTCIHKSPVRMVLLQQHHWNHFLRRPSSGSDTRQSFQVPLAGTSPHRPCPVLHKTEHGWHLPCPFRDRPGTPDCC